MELTKRRRKMFSLILNEGKENVLSLSLSHLERRKETEENSGTARKMLQGDESQNLTLPPPLFPSPLSFPSFPPALSFFFHFFDRRKRDEARKRVGKGKGMWSVGQFGSESDFFSLLSNDDHRVWATFNPTFIPLLTLTFLSPHFFPPHFLILFHPSL